MACVAGSQTRPLTAPRLVRVVADADAGRRIRAASLTRVHLRLPGGVCARTVSPPLVAAQACVAARVSIAAAASRLAFASRAYRARVAACVRILVLGGLLGGVASGARAQQLALPVDVAQGLELTGESPTPYLFSVSVAPSLELGPLRLGVVLAPSYRNPAWDLGLGGRLSVFVPLAAREVGLRIGAQGEYLPWAHDARLSGLIMLEAFGLLRLGLWPAYVVGTQRGELMFSVGVDVVSWAQLFGSAPPRDRPVRALSVDR